jgi:O-antigen/teichoic acid export membrane protein
VVGAKGHGAISVLRIQGVVLVASFVSASSMFGLLTLRRYRPMIIASSSALVLNVVLGVILIPELGARGGALADVVTETVVALGLTITLIRALPLSGISASVIPPILLAAGAGALVILLPIGSVARAVLGSLVYFGVLLLMGSIPDEVTAAARRLRHVRTAA